jgi:hypothetical protein
LTCDDCAALAAENTQLRAEVQKWVEFDFERDNPARLVAHVLGLMKERYRLEQRAEAAEAVLAAIRTPPRSAYPRCPKCTGDVGAGHSDRCECDE